MLANLKSRSEDNRKTFFSQSLLDHLISISTIKQTRKNTYLFQEGLDADEIFLVQSGVIQVTKLTEDGKEIILRICNQYDIVGELSIFSNESKYSSSGKVMSHGVVYVIKKEKLEEALLTNSNLALEYMKWCSIQLRKYQTKIRDLMFNGKKGALYSTLIRLSNSYGIEQENGILVNIVLTNQELANFCGATRESINRMLIELRKLDIISIEPSGKIFIKNLSYLKTTICCENCPIEICNIN